MDPDMTAAIMLFTMIMNEYRLLKIGSIDEKAFENGVAGMVICTAATAIIFTLCNQ